MSGEFDMPAGACAACKYQRKRCNESCVLGRYFPLDRAEDFENVQRLFGIQNAVKILNSVAENEREKTVESLILEARMRRENPVHGPVEVEMRLRAEMERVKKELDMVKKELKFFKGDDDHDHHQPSSSTF
ncbi:LOB domain-containing protein 27 [Sesamum angolense]|uniref:LOB domain-containing protein 27 n=1 Tax=Sesamum angolense TaxID=2727404 RepID=A0AAE1WPK0_9LAMI|nr:LOB domain-containing protein 27 [Sesamum angolense]